MRRRARGRAARRCCCPATSSARSSGWPTGSRSSATGRAVESGTLAELRHLRRTRVRAELARRRAGPVPASGRACTTSRSTATACHLHGRPRGAARRARGADRGRRRSADQHAADAGGAVPRRLPDRRRAPMTDDASSALARLLRLALRRDRVLLPVWVAAARAELVYASAAATGRPLPRRGRPGRRRPRAHQRQPGAGRALRPDPRRAQPRRGLAMTR